MTSTLNKDSKIVLKLDLGAHGMRRISFHKLWDESRSSVSYDRLVELAIGLKNLKQKAVENGRITLSTTYIDEDGDEITISSDEELAEAFAQFINSDPPVVRAKAVISRPGQSNNSRPSKKMGGNVQKKGPRFQNRAVRIMKENLNRVDKAPLPPVVRLPSPPPPPKVTSENVDIAAAAAGCDPHFIHGRHTCDGCLSTPIYGIRYHAMDHADYDLCSNCYGNYKGPDLKFKPMQLDRDRHLQTRFHRRQMRRCRQKMVRTTGLDKTGVETKNPCASVASGTQTKKVIDGMDEDLKEAIRRSLVDACSKNTKQDDTTETDSVSVTEKKGLPVAQVVEVAAGNDHTQAALAAMDSKAKEALSRKLNEFFAHRFKRDESSTLKEKHIDLSADKDTRKKIDTMDPVVKEAIRRSLTQFFSKRCESKENKEEGDVYTSEPKEESNTKKEILECFNESSEGRLSEEDVCKFLEAAKNNIPDKLSKGDVHHIHLSPPCQGFSKANRFCGKDAVATEVRNDTLSIVDDEDDDLPSITVDIIVDDEDDDLTQGSEDEDDLTEGSEDEEDDLTQGSEDEEDELVEDTDDMHDLFEDPKLVEDTDDMHDLFEDPKLVEDTDDMQTNNRECNEAKDEWQMVSEDDDMIAMAAQMLGSALFQSDASLARDSL